MVACKQKTRSNLFADRQQYSHDPAVAYRKHTAPIVASMFFTGKTSTVTVQGYGFLVQRHPEANKIK